MGNLIPVIRMITRMGIRDYIGDGSSLGTLELIRMYTFVNVVRILNNR